MNDDARDTVPRGTQAYAAISKLTGLGAAVSVSAAIASAWIGPWALAATAATWIATAIAAASYARSCRGGVLPSTTPPQRPSPKDGGGGGDPDKPIDKSTLSFDSDFTIYTPKGDTQEFQP